MAGSLGLRRARREVALVGMLVLFCALAGCLFSGAPALALSQRGHAFSFSFGAAGAGAGQFTEPSAVAVNDASGDVYVADRANDRVEQFAPRLGSHGELEGEEFVREFAVPYPEGVAVDNSATSPSKGDVYVVGTKAHLAKGEEIEDKLVYKFNAEGTAIVTLKKFQEPGEKAETFEKIEGIAVDPVGDLFVYGEEQAIDVFDNAAGENKSMFGLESPWTEAMRGFALDSEDDPYVAYVSKNAAAGEPQGEPSVISKLEAGIEEVLPVLEVELDQQATTAVAVNRANEPANDVSELNDVYIANVATVAGEPQSSIAAFNAAGAPLQRFSAPGLKQASGIAVDSRTGVVYVTDSISDKVDVFALEAPGPPHVDAVSSEQIATEANSVTLTAQVDPSGADTHAYFEYGAVSCVAHPSSCARTPEADLGSAFQDVATSAPLAGLQPGTYHYRVVASNSFETVASAEGTFTIATTFSGLPDGRAWEMVSPPRKDGAEAEPITAEGGTIQAAADGLAITYVADGPIPAETQIEGSRSPEPTQVLSERKGSAGWASQDISTANGSAKGIGAGAPREYFDFSPNLSLSLVEPWVGGNRSGPLEEPPLSPPVEFENAKGEHVTESEQEKTVYLHDDAPIEPEAAEAANYQAARKNGEIEKNAGFLALLTHANAPAGAPFGGGKQAGIEVLGASPDLSHVVFRSYRTPLGLWEWGPGALTQRTCSIAPSCQMLHPVSTLPGGGAALAFGLGGGEDNDVGHAISDDGTRVFWTSAADLYLRDTETEETSQLDAVLSGAGEGAPNAVFQTASADGSKVFFTDSQRLIAASKAGGPNGAPIKPDLYVFELGASNQAPGCAIAPAGRLCDLTQEGVNGEPADVLGERQGAGVLGASEEGSYVYFVADGVLVPGAPSGNCQPGIVSSTATCELYMRHYNGAEWEPPKLIAVLAEEDAPDWGTGSAGDHGEQSARVSPNGQFLAFMSKRSLTGYDNEDVTSQKSGERLDEEVFLYSARSEGLVCASCNPSGARPQGVLDTTGFEGFEGGGLVVDRRQVWGTVHEIPDHWIAGIVPGWTSIALTRAVYQSRYLSNEGRLFFDSPDHVVPASTTAKDKVYEYEPNGVGSCAREGGCIGLVSSGSAQHEAAFLDASESGDDVFFLSAEQLVASDFDSNFDVYDARVCEASGSCPPPPPPVRTQCEQALACKGAPPALPPFAAPPSSTASPSGNVLSFVQEKLPVHPPPKPLTRAQKLAKALKACHKDRQKKKRLACEKAARKKYGPIKHVAKKASPAKEPAPKPKESAR